MQAELEPSGRLPANVMQFARLLREAGMPVGSDRVIEAVESLSAIRLTDREEFRAALRAVFVTRRSQLPLFDEAFELFFRDPFSANVALSLLLPRAKVGNREGDPISRRLADATRKPREAPAECPPDQEHDRRIDAVMTASEQELLRTRDFEQMSAEEIRRAKEAIRRLRLTTAEVPTRRFRADARGSRVDLRATIRASFRSGADDIPLRFRVRRRRPPPLVVLCDISGSMERYSRLLLHFVHTLTSLRARVSSFVFGTRLTHITRAMRHRDIDEALEGLGRRVSDWGGGTRIGRCLEEFNRDWGRRVLAQGAVLLLVTDGLERDDPELLAREMARLSRTTRRLVWLNPLLRYDGFEPLARGVAAMMPHVDELRPVHDLKSLEALCLVLERGDARSRRPARRRRRVGRAEEATR